MKRFTLSIAMLGVTLAGCAQRTVPPMASAPLSAPGGVGVAVAGTVTIWRGVNADANGQIDWSKNSFGVSQGTLSFLSAQGAEKQCWLEITVDAPNVPVQPNQGGTIAVVIPGNVAFKLPPPPAASPWAAVFDNNPAGHWSIAQATIGGPSGNGASFNAAAVFKATWDTPNQAVIVVHNGTNNNCHG